MISGVKGFTIADIGSGAAEVVIARGKGELTGNAAVWLRRKGLVGACGEAHPTVSTKEEGASHGFVGYNVHPNCKGRGRRAVVVELDGHSGLSIRAE